MASSGNARAEICTIAWVLMYADDIVIVTASEGDMQAALELTDATFAQWALKISIKKTKA